MVRKQNYTVAEHSFCFELEENDLVWKRLTHSFAPFEVETECDRPIFTLTVCKQLDASKEAKPLFINPHPNPPGGRVNVYQTGQGYLFELFPYSKETDQSYLHITENGEKAEILLEGSEIERFNRVNTALMLCFLMTTIKLNTLLLHASAIVNEEKCYLFLGRSGTGKSTHSGLWLQHIPGSKLLNDDHPIIRIHPDGKVKAYGSPWSGKTACYKNECALLGGIVRIKQAPHNRLKCLSPIEAYASVMTSCCWGFNWNKDLMKSKDLVLQSMIEKVNCYTLECLPNKEAAILCAENISKK